MNSDLYVWLAGLSDPSERGAWLQQCMEALQSTPPAPPPSQLEPLLLLLAALALEVVEEEEGGLKELLESMAAVTRCCPAVVSE